NTHIVNGAPKLVKDEEAVTNIEILENGFAAPSPSVYKLEALHLNE
ncbi:oxidoreductase, partial [Bacillus thuringiensis]|nr:oxidoreductase [Bacillus thuringiensis]